MHRVLALSMLSLAAAAYAQPQTATKAPHGSTSATSSPSAAKRTLTHGHVAAGSTKRSTPSLSRAAGGKAGNRSRAQLARGVRPRAKPGPSYQLHPDPERYQQIQQALADRGYFKGQANGEWGGDSVDALKKFQADQKLESDGKINALSLTGLGLGPKHDGTSGRETPIPPPPSGGPTSPLAPATEPPAAAPPPR